MQIRVDRNYASCIRDPTQNGDDLGELVKIKVTPNLIRRWYLRRFRHKLRHEHSLQDSNPEAFPLS